MNIIKYCKHTFVLFLTLVFAALMLTACGGGGGGVEMMAGVETAVVGERQRLL